MTQPTSFADKPFANPDPQAEAAVISAFGEDFDAQADALMDRCPREGGHYGLMIVTHAPAEDGGGHASFRFAGTSTALIGMIRSAINGRYGEEIAESVTRHLMLVELLNRVTEDDSDE